MMDKILLPDVDSARKDPAQLAHDAAEARPASRRADINEPTTAHTREPASGGAAQRVRRRGRPASARQDWCALSVAARGLTAAGLLNGEPALKMLPPLLSETFEEKVQHHKGWPARDGHGCVGDACPAGNCFNLRVSDSLPLDRALGDMRHADCLRIKYSADLPIASVVFVFYNEPLSPLLRCDCCAWHGSDRAQFHPLGAQPHATRAAARDCAD